MIGDGLGNILEYGFKAAAAFVFCELYPVMEQELRVVPLHLTVFMLNAMIRESFYVRFCVWEYKS